MAEIRTLKLNLLADVDNFSRGLKTADKKTSSWSKGVSKASKIAAGAFAAAGAAAIAYGISAVKAASEDEAAQKKLAKSLKNTTKATDKQIASTEDWISTQQMAFGVSDMKLRPALQRLAASTKDIGKAQKLTNLALDISAGTGKDLTSVANALGKAYDGNLGALKKLGVPLDANIVKSKDFNAATKALAETFSGQAATAAGTFQGQLNILKERIGEFQEGIGAKLLPVLSRALKAVMEVADGFGGKTGLAKNVGQASDALSAARDAKYENSWYSVGAALKEVADSLSSLLASFSEPGGQSSIKTFADTLQSIANGLNAIKDSWNNLPAFWKTGEFGPNGMFDITPWSKANSKRNRRALGGPVTAGGSYLVGERGPEIFTPRSSGSIAANGSGGTTIIMNGIVDGESARRSIERLFQTSSRISGAPNFTGAIS